MDSNLLKLCIEKAHEAKITSAQRQLKKMMEDGVSLENPFEGIFSSQKRGGKTETIKQALLSPVILLYFLLLIIMSFMQYIIELWDFQKKKRIFKKKIMSQKIDIEDADLALITNLKELWVAYGLNKHQYHSSERIDLLSMWIEILYGKEMKDSLNINQRIQEIEQKHIEANISYYEGNSFLYIFFISAVDVFIKNLTEHELKRSS